MFSITINFSQTLGINATGSAGNSKALLDVDATGMSPKAGMLIPRLTTAERNTLSGSGTVPESLLIYNTTTQCFETWNQSMLSWVQFGCINCQLPGVFSSSSATSVTSTTFTANWSSSTGATGYYLDVSTSSTFASYVGSYHNLDVSNVTTYGITGLSASTTYYYRVRAYNSCGTGTNTNTTTQVTYAVGCLPTQVEADYGTVVSSLSGSSQTWITRNLGATAQASSATDNSNAAAGCYFQFNRSQAYGFDNGGSVNPAWTITSISENLDWLIANDPCRLQLGGSWRLPTYTEWFNTDANGGWTSYTNTYASVLKIHTAGYLEPSAGGLIDRGVRGYYWSSAQDVATTSWELYLGSGGSNMGTNVKAFGFSVRCLK